MFTVGFKMINLILGINISNRAQKQIRTQLLAKKKQIKSIMFHRCTTSNHCK